MTYLNLHVVKFYLFYPMAKNDNENYYELICQAKEGDLLEFKNGLFSHWAVYVGMYRCICLLCIIAYDLYGALSGRTHCMSSSLLSWFHPRTHDIHNVVES